MKKSIIEKLLTEKSSDAVLLYSPQNRFWFTRFASSLGYLLITKKGSYLFLDGRYVTAAKTSDVITNVDEIISVIPGKDSFFSLINQKVEKDSAKKVLIESDWLTVAQANGFKNNIKAEMIEYNFESIREVKDSFEIDSIKKACDITHSVFMDVIDWVKPGITEKDLARFVSDCFLKHGAQKLSFDTIVASGENGSMPHAVPTDKVIKENEFVTLDMGCYYNGYCSDQTRTFAIGEGYNSKLKEIYDIVYKSQSAGIEMIKPGVKCVDVHNKCFEVIDQAGYGQYFTHGTGHGLGIEIHEEPYNASGSKKILEENMTVTVEPGIYIPGIGGVRIEDDILVTKTGYEFLTTPLRELQVVKVNK